MIPDSVELSVCIGVGVLGCIISSNVCLITSPSLELMNCPHNSAFVADAMTFFRIAATTNTDSLCLVGELLSKWSVQKNCSPTLFIYLDTNKYN